MVWESGEKWEGFFLVVFFGLSRNFFFFVERGRWVVVVSFRSNYLEEEFVWFGRLRRVRGEKLGRSLGRIVVSAGVGGFFWRVCRFVRGFRLVCGFCIVSLLFGGELLG